jgi:hypothetical protein
VKYIKDKLLYKGKAKKINKMKDDNAPSSYYVQDDYENPRVLVTYQFSW